MRSCTRFITGWFKTILFIQYCLCSFSAFAQIQDEGIPFIRNFTQQDYKAAPQNWAIVQDHRGIMYFGNNYGILEFDGNHWRQFGIANRTIVRSLAIDKEGTIYVGGQDDFGYLQPDAQGQMAYVSLKARLEKKYQNFDDVWKIFVTDEGILFCTLSFNFYLRNNRLKAYPADPAQSSPPFYVREKVFIPINGKGIFELKNEKMHLIPHSEAFGTYIIAAMLPYEENKTLIVTEQHGLFLYDGYSDFRKWDSPSEAFCRENTISTAIALTEGYALGSTHNGLLITDKNGVPRQHLNREKGLQNNAVQTIYQDYAGNIWLGLSNGIDYVEINSPFTLFNSKNGLPGTAYTSLIDGGKLYLGTNDGLYVKDWSPNKNPLNAATFELVKGTQGQVYTLQKMGNNLLLSHHNGPFEIMGNQAIRLSEHRGAWLFLPLQAHPGYVICGTYTGLLLYQSVQGKLVFRHKIGGFHESSRVMEEDAAGNIWVAHGYKGIYKIRLSDQLDKVAKMSFYDARAGFPSNLFINVFKVNHQLVYAGERGVYRYNESKDRFEAHEGLQKMFAPNQHIRKLIEDKEGNIWFSAGTEMGVLKKRSNGSYDVEKKVFNKLEGKLVAGFEHIAYYSPKDVLIGTDEGFVHYNPSFPANKNQEYAFYALVRRVDITTNTQDSLLSGGTFREKNAPSSHQPESTIPQLPYASNSLKFTYSAVAYENIEKIAYQYWLEGFDQQWSAWSPAIGKEYTNLREGKYTFRVKAKDIYNRESTEASYQFVVAPPWYRSFWAFLAYALLGLLLSILAKKRIDWNIHKTQQRLKQEQEKELQLKKAQHMEEALQAEKEIIKLNNEKLENELIHKNKELASSTMHVMHSLDAIQKVRAQLQDVIDHVRDREVLHHLRRVLKSVEDDIKFENNWEQFEFHFNQIHQDFLKRLKDDFPELTHRDIKLCAYLRLNLSSKEIAPLLNLSLRGIEASRYRIRKKMDLDQDINLTDFILKY